jgi:hypothetical protein
VRIEQHLLALLLLTLLLGGCTTLHVQVDRWGGAALTVPTMADVYVGSHIGWGLGLQTLPHRAAFLAYAQKLMNRDAYKRAVAKDEALLGSAAKL